MLASHGFVSCFSLHQRARLCLALDPRRANRAGEMLGRPSQAANVSTLLDAKKRSSLVISGGLTMRWTGARYGCFRWLA